MMCFNLALGLCGALSCVVTPAADTLIQDSFDAPASVWQGVCLRGDGKRGTQQVTNGQMVVTAAAPDGIHGVWHTTPVSGHFVAEVEFAEDGARGLALIQEKNGAPDTDNFTAICVDKDRAGHVVVRVRDRQNGIDDVLDSTSVLLNAYKEKFPGKPRLARALMKRRYRHVLTNCYSLPFTETAGKLRIMRDSLSGFFHFYYAVKKNIRGRWAEGWVELAPSRDWGREGQKYYVALLTLARDKQPAKAAFENLRVARKPTRDQDDRNTGFAITRREFTWSGFAGDAWVVSFGDKFAFRDRDIKFVFWSCANYVPVWAFNNQLLFSYEFVETWGGGVTGCHEPMSDRLLRWSRVNVLEDNAVRKVLRWHYVLCNPDYKVPDNDIGTQLPEVDETWTFHPDGKCIRHIVYRPKLDATHREWNELVEFIPIAGSKSNPEDHLKLPALSILNLEGEVCRFFPKREFHHERIDVWNQVIAAAHFKNCPDAFLAISNARDTPDMHPHYPVWVDISWHNTCFKLCHWPVGLEPYQLAVKTHGDWRAQVSHTCLMGAGCVQGADWKDRYSVDDKGRKYREWIMLVGLNEPDGFDALREKTAAWAYPGTVRVVKPGIRFIEYNHRRGEFVFEALRGATQCEFVIHPMGKSKAVINPVFRIVGWSNDTIRLTINGKALEPDKDFITAIEKNAVLIWLNGMFNIPCAIGVRH